MWSAPGRVNLIGEHTDYNDGLVLPFALPLRIAVAAAPRPDRVISVASAGWGGVIQYAEPWRIDDLRPGSVTGWPAYVAGVVWALRERDGCRGADLMLASDLPSGAGLSSSAALECAVALALHEMTGTRDAGDIDRRDLAAVAQRAENEFVGVPCGMLDQLAALCCIADHAMFLDVRTGNTEQIPFDATAAGLRVLIIDTRVNHSLASSEYAQRRAASQRAARLLGLPALRELSQEGLDGALSRLPAELAGPVRHVVTENTRVLDVAARLRSGRLADIGPLLDASHESLRDDYRVSCPELDLAVSEARSAGALGARMTGGGFGGSAIALIHAGDRARVAGEVSTAFARQGLRAPRFLDAVPSAGAGKDS